MLILSRLFSFLHFTSEYAKEALELIDGLVVEGRQLRVDVKARVAKEEGVERKVGSIVLKLKLLVSAICMQYYVVLRIDDR